MLKAQEATSGGHSGQSQSVSQTALPRMTRQHTFHLAYSHALAKYSLKTQEELGTSSLQKCSLGGTNTEELADR